MVTPDTPRSPPPGTGKWEGEGGALAPGHADELPAGVTAISVTHYRVGSYTYTNLDDAMAEHRRQSGPESRK